MKARIFGILVFIFSFSSSITATEPAGFGLGIMLGEPTGISAKKWIASNVAVDGALAWSFSGSGSFHIHSDILFHEDDLFNLPRIEGRMPLYYGPGVRFKTKDKDNDNGDDARLGIRFPVGLTYIFPRTPLDIFLEIVPIFDLIPETDFSLNLAIGVRYFF